MLVGCDAAGCATAKGERIGPSTVGTAGGPLPVVYCAVFTADSHRLTDVAGASTECNDAKRRSRSEPMKL